LALALTACSSGGGANRNAAAPSAAVTTDATAAAPNRSPAPGEPLAARASCDTPRAHAAGNSDETIDSGGLARHYILHVPPSYDGTKRTPIVISLHGAGSTASAQAAYSRFPAKADSEGFILISPDAAGSRRAWNFIPLAGGSDDVGFIRDVLGHMSAEFCIDDARIYATGISSGAAMSVKLACALQDRIAAIGPVAALYYPPNCTTAKAMPIIEFHGTEDKLVPFSGGTTVGGLPSPDTQFAASQWAKADGCNAEPARERVSEHVRSVAYSECSDGAVVVQYIVEGGGHTWPGAVNIAGLGETTHEISATDEIWRFFAAH
jgi:polyhydroxybutyrate depolymerase